MSTFTFNFGGKEVTPLPFVFKWDYNLTWSGDDNTPSDAYPNYKDEFSTVLQVGDIIDVKELLRSKYEEYRANREIVSETFTAITYELDGTNYSIEYTIGYNPSSPNILTFYIANPSGYPTTTQRLDYRNENENQWDRLEHMFCVYMIELANMPDFTYDGKYLLNLCAFRPSFWWSTTKIVIDKLIPEIEFHEELDRIPKSLFDVQNMDSLTRSLIPVMYGTANTLAVNNFTDEDETVRPCGISTHYEFDNVSAGEIKVNGYDVDFSKIGTETPEDTPSGGNSWSGGFSATSTPIGFPNLPSIDSLSTGFIHAYYLAPSVAVSLANYMLSNDFIDNVKKLMGNPIDYLCGAVMLPISVGGNVEDIKIGGIDTQIKGTRILKQYTMIDCGSIDCPMLWKGFPDFAPSTKVSIFLPFIGVRELNTNDVMGGKLTLKYYVDNLTGACVAIIRCTLTSSLNRKLDSVLYHFSGQMGVNIPITASDYSRKISNIVNGAVSAVGGYVSGSAPSMAGGVASIVTGSLMRPTINRSGNLSGDAGMLDNYTPYLIIEYPYQSLPANYKALNGYASKIGGKFSDFSGYVEIDEINLDGVTITEDEKERLLQKLKGGVYK